MMAYPKFRIQLGIFIGISETERKRRKESNLFTTKINFIAWLLEVSQLKEKHPKIHPKIHPEIHPEIQAL